MDGSKPTLNPGASKARNKEDRPKWWQFVIGILFVAYWIYSFLFMMKFIAT